MANENVQNNETDFKIKIILIPKMLQSGLNHLYKMLILANNICVI